MNGTLPEAQRLAGDVRNGLGSFHAADVVVFPPAPFLSIVQTKMRGSQVAVGAQDIHPEKKGAFTSGVSAPMVKSLGCGWTLVGHSERRAWFGDGDQRVADKLTRAVGCGLKAILCIGETLAEREQGRTFDVCQRQLDSALRTHSAGALGDLVIAYEPVWAIGTGLTATPEQAQEVHASIRSHLAGTHGAAFADAIRIQYGGSVKPNNAAALMACPDIDGALVGGASLDGRSFKSIVYAAAGRSAQPTWMQGRSR